MLAFIMVYLDAAAGSGKLHRAKWGALQVLFNTAAASFVGNTVVRTGVPS